MDHVNNAPVCQTLLASKEGLSSDLQRIKSGGNLAMENGPWVWVSQLSGTRVVLFTPPGLGG